MIITETFLDKHRTARGYWTNAQLTAIGVPLPPPSGWRRRVIGLEISDDAVKAFITGKDMRSHDRQPPSLF